MTEKVTTAMRQTQRLYRTITKPENKATNTSSNQAPYPRLTSEFTDPYRFNQLSFQLQTELLMGICYELNQINKPEDERFIVTLNDAIYSNGVSNQNMSGQNNYIAKKMAIAYEEGIINATQYNNITRIFSDFKNSLILWLNNSEVISKVGLSRSPTYNISNDNEAHLISFKHYCSQRYGEVENIFNTGINLCFDSQSDIRKLKDKVDEFDRRIHTNNEESISPEEFAQQPPSAQLSFLHSICDLLNEIDSNREKPLTLNNFICSSALNDDHMLAKTQKAVECEIITEELRQNLVLMFNIFKTNLIKLVNGSIKISQLSPNKYHVENGEESFTVHSHLKRMTPYIEIHGAWGSNHILRLKSNDVLEFLKKVDKVKD